MLLPLTLSAHASGWDPAGSRRGNEEQVSLAGETCQFCGFGAAGWQAPFHLDGDHDNASRDNVALACPLCHLCQHMDRPHIVQEAVLVWLPEVSQAATIALARRIHLVLRSYGEPPHMERGRPLRSGDALSAAWAAQLSLRARAKPAQERIGTSSPADFAAALLGLSPNARARGSSLLFGLRLLPLGRIFDGQHDKYPLILDAWAALECAPGASMPARPRTST